MKTLYGALIRKQREEKGMTIAELSDRCMIREKYLEQAERGEMVLSHVDLVLICNVLDISSAALAEGRLMRKPGVPELEELIRKLEEKMDELRESIREMKEAAAFLKNEVTEKGAAIDEAVNPPELSAVSKDPEKEQGKELEKAPETGTVQPVPNQAEPAGPVL